MYSRNFSRRGRDFNSGTGYEKSESTARPNFQEPVPPPSYSGTLYISAREGRNTKEKNEIHTEVAHKPNRSADGEVRTVMYNGEPYVPDEIGIYPEDDERFGRGGLPQIGSDRLRFKKPDTEHSDNKEIFDFKSFNEQAPPIDDIILTALIIILLGEKSSGKSCDELLLIILGILLLSGRT